MDTEAAIELYTGSVTHVRLSPARHSFSYGLCMALIDVDRLPELFAGWWPLASATTGRALLAFREEDHLRGGCAPPRRAGQSLGDAVRDAVERATGARPPPSARGRLLTHLSVFGYCFNPISLYFVEEVEDGGAPTRLRTVVAEVSNTPWNEMHLYVLDSRAEGVEASQHTPGASGATPHTAESDADAQLVADGAVAPTAFDALVSALDERVDRGAGSRATGPPPGRGLVRPGTRYRFRWSKSFHVSPFMAMAQTYDWAFTQPSRTLLVQSRNLQDGACIFSTQLRLERSPAPFTRATLLWMLFWAYPVLTWRVQWWIHVEAFRLWFRGVQRKYARIHPYANACVSRPTSNPLANRLFLGQLNVSLTSAVVPHPTGATNAFVNTVHAIMTPLLWAQDMLARKKGE